MYGERLEKIKKLEAAARQAQTRLRVSKRLAACLPDQQHRHRKAHEKAARTKRFAVWEWRSYLRRRRDGEIADAMRLLPATRLLVRVALACERIVNLIESGFDRVSSAFATRYSRSLVGLSAFLALVANKWPWLFDWSPKPFVVFGASAITLFGFSIASLISLELLSVDIDWSTKKIEIHFLWDPPVECEECAETPARAVPFPVFIPIRVESEANDTSTSILFPDSSIPVFWRLGSDRELLQGYDRRRADLTSFTNDVCTEGTVVAIGAASLEGSELKNVELSRSRAITLAQQASQRMSRCTRPPDVFAVAMRSPRSNAADAIQRRAAVVAVTIASDATSREILAAWLSSPNVQQQSMLASAPADYESVEWCAFRASSCEWVRIR